MTQISELVAGAETLRAYDAGPHFAEQVEKASHERSNSFIRAGTIGAFLFPSGEVFSVFTVAAVVGVGVFRGPASGLTAGAMVGFLFLTYKFLEPIAEFTEVLDQTQTAVAGMRRVLGVLEIPIGPPEPDGAAQAAGRLAGRHARPRRLQLSISWRRRRTARADRRVARTFRQASRWRSSARPGPARPRSAG